MIMQDNKPNELSPRENFLLSLLNKVIREYKTLLDFTRKVKPLKIIEIVHLSTVPGESIFAVQVTNKNCVLQLSAGEIIHGGYRLTDFSDYHAEMIKQAAQGKLVQYLNLTEGEAAYKILAKIYDKEKQQYVFTIGSKDNCCFSRTLSEIVRDEKLLSQLGIQDVYDIGYTKGSESVVKERMEILLVRRKI